jgi:hypothetical protein
MKFDYLFYTTLIYYDINLFFDELGNLIELYL